MRPLAERASVLGEVSRGLLLPLVVAGLMFGSACGAPDVVRRAQPAGGSGGQFFSSSSDGTAGVAGSTASTPPEGGSSRPASAGSSGGPGGTSVAGGAGAAGGASATGGKGGTSAGGAGGKGGASATGGKGGAGSTGGKGGGGGAGGSSYIGASGITTSPFAGSGGGGGTPDTSAGGTGDTGGAGGSSDVTPPPVDSLAVWVDTKTGGSTGKIALTLRIDNKTASSVDMAAVTLRYWYQDEGLGTALVYANDYVKIGYSIAATATGKVVAAPSPVAGADHYIELSFTGTVAPQGDKSSGDQFTLHVTAHTASYTGTVDVTNDYSYDGGAEKVYEKKITLHDKDGNVLWGTPPGGKGSPGPADGGS